MFLKGIVGSVNTVNMAITICWKVSNWKDIKLTKVPVSVFVFLMRNVPVLKKIILVKVGFYILVMDALFKRVFFLHNLVLTILVIVLKRIEL